MKPGSYDHIVKPFFLGELTGRIKVQFRGQTVPVRTLNNNRIGLQPRAADLPTGKSPV